MKTNKLILLIVAIVLSIGAVNAQTVKPQFKGGEPALNAYIVESLYNLTIPEITEEPEDDIVKVRFLVGKTGKISSVTAISGTHKENKDAAIQIVKSMPDWIPGKKNGVLTAMYDTLIIDWRMMLVEFVAPKSEEDTSITDSDGTKLDIAELGRIESRKEEKIRRDEVFKVVEQMPEFPGGNEELFKFISDNLKYPESAAKEGIEGRVVLRFVVDKDGSIKDVQIMRGLDPACDKEALCVIKAMPKWVPGKQNGVAVPVYFTLPVRFKLTKEEDEKIIQEEVEEKPVIKKRRVSENREAVEFVEVMPEFPGGEEKMYQFIRDNMKYPKYALDNGISGRVIIRFIVKEDGSISNVKLVRGIDQSCDKEAMRIVKSMPKWIPGKQNGVDITIAMTIRVTFKLPEKD